MAQTRTDTNEPTNYEILEAINGYATSNDKRMASLELEIVSMKALMVTKDYLDDKLADLRGDILTVIRKEDSRLTTLVEILHTKKILDEGDVNVLQRLQPLVQIPI